MADRPWAIARRWQLPTPYDASFLAARQGRGRTFVGGWSTDPETVILDTCGEDQGECLRLWHEGGDTIREYYVDADGNCLYGRFWSTGTTADEHVLERHDRRYRLAWEQIPNRLVRAIWT